MITARACDQSEWSQNQWDCYRGSAIILKSNACLGHSWLPLSSSFLKSLLCAPCHQDTPISARISLRRGCKLSRGRHLCSYCEANFNGQLCRVPSALSSPDLKGACLNRNTEWPSRFPVCKRVWHCGLHVQVTIDMGHRAPKGSIARRRGLVGVRTIRMPEAADGAEDEEQWLFESSQVRRITAVYSARWLLPDAILNGR
eukprot:1157455-Pelagomonas_calceolata.AAC.8